MIRSTFAGFTTAHLGMSASQRALDVTGQNIANINTPGYTRQRLDIASLNTQRGDFYNTSSNIKVGFGVEMTRISQLRDPFLDSQYRSQISKLGTTDAHAAGFEQLATIFDESTMLGVRNAFISLSSSLNTLSKEAGNKENDTAVRSNMQVLLNLFHDAAVRLQDIREDTQRGFATTDIKDVNELLDNIAELNKSIKTSQVLGNPALELQDQRNSLLDELGSYLPITVKYKDKPIGPNQTVEILDVSFTDTTGQKHTLISDGYSGQFYTDVSGEPVTLSFSDANGTTRQLAGMVRNPDTGNVEYVEVLGSGTLKGTLDLLNKSGDFDQTDFKGIGYYEKALDALVNQFALTFNEANKSVEKDADGNIIDPDNLIDRDLFTTSDNSGKFTAMNIKIADDWLNGTYGITITNNVVKDEDGSTGETGSTANEVIMNMIKLLDSTSHEFRGGDNNTKFYSGTFHDCFATLENTLGIDTKSANTLLDNQISVLNQTSNSRDGVSGVQLDEEGMNLLHYNQSYNAAARLMTTLDEALDKLINGTGVVGR